MVNLRLSDSVLNEKTPLTLKFGAPIKYFGRES